MLQLVSSTQGRLRWKNPRLKKMSLPGALLNKIKAIDGIRELNHNSITGSLLVCYTPDKNKQEIEQATQQILNQYLSETTNKQYLRYCNRIVKAGSIITWGVCVAALGLKAYKIHAGAGILGLGLLGFHTYYHRKRLLK